jgi:hypothetical protein
MDIIKTWPACVGPRQTARIFSAKVPPWHWYYFTLGRGKPKQAIDRMWFTYGGRILGSFAVKEIVCNDGSLPALNRLDGGESGWQIARDAWVAVCPAPITRIQERIFYEGFRGWRYFDLESHKVKPLSRVRF